MARRPLHFLPRAATLTAILMTVGCVSGSQGEPETRVREVAALAADTTEFQAQILEDGVVTDAEYEAAMLAARSCVEAMGFSVGQIQTIAEDGSLGFVYGGTEDPAQLDDADQCFMDYVNDVAVGRRIQVAPTERENLERYNAFKDCMVAAGYESTPLPTSRDEVFLISLEAGEQGVACLAEARFTQDYGYDHDIPGP